MKIRHSHSINPFGGVNFVLESISDLGINDILNKELPPLAVQSKYKWSDILNTFWSIYFCGGDCIEDCAGNLRQYLNPNPLVNLCSPDRIIDRFKQLSKANIYPISYRSKKKHEFSVNDKLNSLGISILKKLNDFSCSKNILDYDNTVIHTNKADSKYSYLNKKGYCPGVGFLNNQVVYVENRNGNSDAGSHQAQTLQRMFDLLNQHKIKIHSFRADSASYQWDILKLLVKQVEVFYLSARRSADLARTIGNIEHWKKIKVGKEVLLRGETLYTPFKSASKRVKESHLAMACRIVVTKSLRSDGQIDVFSKEAFNYKVILTNDFKSSANDIVNTYNQRGTTEKEFDILKNDFGWKQLPFSKLEYNNVYLIFSAMCRNIYAYIIKQYSKSFKWLKESFRIKKFIYRFISIPAKWIRHSRQDILIIHGPIRGR